MPDYLGTEQRKVKEEEKDDGPIRGYYTQHRLYFPLIWLFEA